MAEWSGQERPDRNLARRFDQAVDAAEGAIRQAQVDQRNAARDRLRQQAVLLKACELAGDPSGDPMKAALAALEADWPDAEADGKLERQLQSRKASWLAGKVPPDLDSMDPEALEAAARLLCIRLEFLSGLASPDEDREQRMQYQVERLSQRLGGEGAGLSARQEARSIEDEWLLMPVLAEDTQAALQSRMDRAINELEKQK